MPGTGNHFLLRRSSVGGVDFETVEMGAIGCKCHTIDSRYCSEINSVNACYDTADSVDTYLRKHRVI